MLSLFQAESISLRKLFPIKPLPLQFRCRHYCWATFLMIMFGLASFSVVILENKYFKLCCLFDPSMFQIILMKFQMLCEGKVVASKSPGKPHKGQVLRALPWQRKYTGLLICCKLEMPTIKARVLFIARRKANIYSRKNSNMTLQQCSPLNRRIITLRSSQHWSS